MNPNADRAASSAEAIEQAAAAWFCKRDSGNWSTADQAAFDAWLNQSTAHRVAHLRLQAGWKGAARMQALGAGIPRGEVPAPGRWGNDRFLGGQNLGAYRTATELAPIHRDEMGRAERSYASASLWALAASAVLALGITLYTKSPYMPWLGDQYSTPVGGQKTVSLEDGTRITLNTNTRLRADFSARERRIDLSMGEAFFEVAKDAMRPFIVYVDASRVTAVGTQFSVRRVGDEDIKVVVTEGRVRLEHDDPVPRLGNLVTASSRPATTLTAGAVARAAKSEVLIENGSASEVEQLLSWRTGYLMFEATSLAEAVAEFNRYNARKIVIDDPQLAALRIGGNFRANNTDAFLWLLQSAFHVTVEERGDRIHLTGR